MARAAAGGRAATRPGDTIHSSGADGRQYLAVVAGGHGTGTKAGGVPLSITPSKRYVT